MSEQSIVMTETNENGLKKVHMKVSTVVFMIFCLVAAGCFGIEEMIPEAGPGLTIILLCASDYHHYCYVDNGYQGEYNHIPVILHSVQPIACEHFPVYVLNKRCWSILESEHFGPILQCEIGL